MGYLGRAYLQGSFDVTYVGAPTTPTTTTTLTVAIVDSADPVWNGDALAYTIEVANIGAIDADNVEVVITLDPQMTYVSASGTGWAVSESGGVVTCTRATLATGAAPAITVNATAPGAAETSSTGVTAVADNASEVNDTETTVVNFVAQDATSGIAVPATAGQWDTLIDTAGVTAVAPTSIYLCQEASAPLADSVGTFPLAAAGTGQTYQQAVAGWSRLAVKLTSGTTGSWVNTDAGLPDMSTTSSLLYMIVAVDAVGPGSTRNLCALGTNAAIQRAITTGVLRNFSGAGSTAGTADPKGRVMPIWLKVDQTGNIQKVYTDQESITATFGAVTGKACRIGSTAAALPDGILYAARWDGAGAEMDDATIAALSETSGWTMP